MMHMFDFLFEVRDIDLAVDGKCDADLQVSHSSVSDLFISFISCIIIVLRYVSLSLLRPAIAVDFAEESCTKVIHVPRDAGEDCSTATRLLGGFKCIIRRLHIVAKESRIFFFWHKEC